MVSNPPTHVCNGRSREGAWIEIATSITINQFREGRSREGAWIEIQIAGMGAAPSTVAPVRERGLK